MPAVAAVAKTMLEAGVGGILKDAPVALKTSMALCSVMSRVCTLQEAQTCADTIALLPGVMPALCYTIRVLGTQGWKCYATGRFHVLRCAEWSSGLAWRIVWLNLLQDREYTALDQAAKAADHAMAMLSLLTTVGSTATGVLVADWCLPELGKAAQYSDTSAGVRAIHTLANITALSDDLAITVACDTQTLEGLVSALHHERAAEHAVRAFSIINGHMDLDRLLASQGIPLQRLVGGLRSRAAAHVPGADALSNALMAHNPGMQAWGPVCSSGPGSFEGACHLHDVLIQQHPSRVLVAVASCVLASLGYLYVKHQSRC